MFSLGRTPKSPNEVYKQARAQIDEGRLESALKLAEQLRAQDFSGAIEVEALVHRARGKYELAAEVLEEGLADGAYVWPNLLLLGSTYSDLGRLDDALTLYQQALECPGVDADWVNYNRAVALGHFEQIEEALAACPNDPTDPELMGLVDILRLGLLNELGRQTKVIELVEFLLGEIESTGGEALGLPKRSEVHYQYAWALWYGMQEPDFAREQAELALRYDPKNKAAGAILYEIDNM
jgi:tetratricopeptide (TPR) repeat protein